MLASSRKADEIANKLSGNLRDLGASGESGDVSGRSWNPPSGEKELCPPRDTR